MDRDSCLKSDGKTPKPIGLLCDVFLHRATDITRQLVTDSAVQHCDVVA